MYDLYNVIMDKIPNIYNHIAYFTQKFYKYFQNITQAWFVLIIYLIRMILLCCFLVYIFIFFRLDYIYKALILLTISVLIKYKFYILKDFVNNNNDKHTHVAKQTCVLPDCEKKKCSQVCDKPLDLGILGHHTHKPLIGRFCSFIDSVDAKGMPHPQYFIPVNEPKVMTAQEKATYGDQIKVDPLQQTYVIEHLDKYDK